MSKSIIVFSGGLDSTTLLHKLLEDGQSVDAVSFDYGQRHRKELEYAERTTNELGVRHDVVDLSGLTPLLAASGSSLVSNTGVPEGHYAQDNMKATVVPNRNMIMLSIAGGIAVARGAEFVATAVHSGDHFIYPDCRPAFLDAVEDALLVGNEGFGKPVYLQIPYLLMTKADIAYEALELGVPLESTWSCYKGGEKHCGKCGTCVERLEAIALARDAWGEDAPEDNTEYEDREFWKEAVASARQA